MRTRFAFTAAYLCTPCFPFCPHFFDQILLLEWSRQIINWYYMSSWIILLYCVNAQDGGTSLHEAATIGDVATVEALLMAGSYTGLRNWVGYDRS